MNKVGCMISNDQFFSIIQSVLIAGEETLKVYESDFAVEQKSDQSPLTQADLRSNEIITRHLKTLNPELPILSEEMDHPDYSVRRNWADYWLIDPLDGTKEFVNRNGEYTVNVALIHGTRPVAGIVYAPVLRCLYYAKEGLGAFKAADMSEDDYPMLHEKSELLRPSLFIEDSRSITDSRLRVVASRSHLNKETEAFIDSLKADFPDLELVSRGSSLKFCMIAEGSAHVYPRFAPTMEWDTAAAQAVCEQAGVKVLDAVTGEPVRYNKESLVNGGFVVGGAGGVRTIHVHR
jgi:3'(2'), 5'-bisphosphate nucleotidase